MQVPHTSCCTRSPSCGVCMSSGSTWKCLSIPLVPSACTQNAGTVAKNTIVRIAGKAPNPDDPDEADSKVFRDDVWMAFSIGLQWCTRFTRLLPNDSARKELVVYMHSMRTLVHKAIQQCLKDAALMETAENDEGILDPPVVEPAEPGPGLPDENLLNAIVSVSGIVNAMVRFCDDMRMICRHVMMSCLMNGYRTHNGFHIQCRNVNRSNLSVGAGNFWKERVGKQLRDEGNLFEVFACLMTREQSHLAEVERVFGVTVSTRCLFANRRMSATINIVVAPPARQEVWPGMSKCAFHEPNKMKEFMVDSRPLPQKATAATIQDDLFRLKQFAVPSFFFHNEKGWYVRSCFPSTPPITLY